MTGSRIFLSCLVAVLTSFVCVQSGWTQASSQPSLPPSEKVAATSKIYSLADIGDDEDFCKWVAETIPVSIQPGSWNSVNPMPDYGTIRYNSSAKILVIYHSPAVHGQVNEFLQGLKKKIPQARVAPAPHVVPASYVLPAQLPTPASPPVQVQSTYPVPYPPLAPKHLFHFIIRYEGEGIIDSNVVKFAKAMSNGSSSPSCSPLNSPSLSEMPIPAAIGTVLGSTGNSQPVMQVSGPSTSPGWTTPRTMPAAEPVPLPAPQAAPSSNAAPAAPPPPPPYPTAPPATPIPAP